MSLHRSRSLKQTLAWPARTDPELAAWHSHPEYEKRSRETAPPQPPSPKPLWMHKRARAASSAYQTPGTVRPRLSIRTPAERNIEEIWQSEMFGRHALIQPSAPRAKQSRPPKGELSSSTQPWTVPTRSTTTPQPLLCSVSETATLVSLYPDDNLCDIIMYTHVRVSKSHIEAVDDMESYTTFTTVCAIKYSKTTCGISFDARFIKASQFKSNISQELAHLRRRNVVHLGVLNMYNYADRVADMPLYVVPAVIKMTRLKGPTSRIIYGIGFFFYNEKISWETLHDVILASLAKDIVVVITCVLSVPSASRCIAMPPTTFRSISDYPPRFDYFVKMADESFDIPSQVLAFSFQMGTLIYNMTYPHRVPADATCERDEKMLAAEKAAGSIATVQGRTLFYTYDTVETMKEKAEFVMTTNKRRANFTWFLFNVHLTDISQKCHPNGPFERLREFRKFYYDMVQRCARDHSKKRKPNESGHVRLKQQASKLSRSSLCGLQETPTQNGRPIRNVLHVFGRIISDVGHVKHVKRVRRKQHGSARSRHTRPSAILACRLLCLPAGGAPCTAAPHHYWRLERYGRRRQRGAKMTTSLSTLWGRLAAVETLLLATAVPARRLRGGHQGPGGKTIPGGGHHGPGGNTIPGGDTTGLAGTLFRGGHHGPGGNTIPGGHHGPGGKTTPGGGPNNGGKTKHGGPGHDTPATTPATPVPVIGLFRRLQQPGGHHGSRGFSKQRSTPKTSDVTREGRQPGATKPPMNLVSGGTNQKAPPPPKTSPTSQKTSSKTPDQDAPVLQAGGFPPLTDAGALSRPTKKTATQ
ncbi:hypothetical protein MTO96_015614, partial [Rhipicephalus appendiculatus]